MNAVQIYVREIQSEFDSLSAREHAYRPALKKLIESVDKTIKAINDPARSKAGAPDFVIQRGLLPIAFAEAKDIGVILDAVEKTDQLKRYREHYNNVVLTDYLEFRWYVEGKIREHLSIGEKRGEKQNEKLHFFPDKFAALDSLLTRFIAESVPEVVSSEDLARRMATLARELARLIENSLNDEEYPSPNLLAQKATFEQELLPGLDNRQFADMFAQTIAYGLFAARVRFKGKPGEFTLERGFWQLPQTNPFLKKMFQNIATELDDRVRFMGEKLAELVAHADMDEILKYFGRQTQQTDPVIHFYETFLSVYDPTQRERRGVYYTPEPVVRYIVRSVDHVLKTHFKPNRGLADEKTLILDPATGTGTFLYFAIKQIYEEIATLGGQKGRWTSYVSDNLLKRLFGFELLMAPYTVAHMKLNILLQEYEYDFTASNRLGIYLTNALEKAVELKEKSFGLGAALYDESAGANAVKSEKPVMVVMGNPPYSGHSANENAWIRELLDSYFYVDGQRLDERNPKWLRDDYVKFIRFGQHRIQQTGYGVLAFVTNHSYLDNPTFRGMRQQLMKSFDELYLLNLHGNSKRKEKTPDRLADKNVFDIQQGVAIGIFVRYPVRSDPLTPPPYRKYIMPTCGAVAVRISMTGSMRMI